MGVTEHLGNIFTVPQGSVLIHACNCMGSWGSGVARGFKDKFPAAYEVYREHCLTPDTTHHKKWLVGTTLLIPPQDEDISDSGSYWIACLFTSLGYGGKVDKPDAILEATRKSMTDLKRKLGDKERQQPGLSLQDKLYTVRINSARFGVAWPRSKKVLEQSLVNIKVINNVHVMREKEKEEVIASMKADGFDAENILSFDSTEGDKVSSKSSQVEKIDMDESGEGAERELVEQAEINKDKKSKNNIKGAENQPDTALKEAKEEGAESNSPDPTRAGSRRAEREKNKIKRDLESMEKQESEPITKKSKKSKKLKENNQD